MFELIFYGRESKLVPEQFVLRLSATQAASLCDSFMTHLPKKVRPDPRYYEWNDEIEDSDEEGGSE